MMDAKRAVCAYCEQDGREPGEQTILTSPQPPSPIRAALREAAGVLGFFAAVILVGSLFVISQWNWSNRPATSPASPSPAAHPYISAVGHLYPGVKLYTGNPPGVTLIGTIDELGKDVGGKRMVGVRWPDGQHTYIDREQILGSAGAYWVHRDDPRIDGK
jgi:hypothetical protein